MPPHWVLQDQQVGPIHAFQFLDDVCWKPTIFRGVALFGLNIETMRIDPVPEVFAPLAGVESHSVQVETVAVQPAASSTSTPERTSWALNEFVSG